MNKKIIINFIALVYCLGIPVHATEYIYRDLIGNSLSSGRCDSELTAMDTSIKNYNVNRFTKKFCQSQGYGWHIEQVKTIGKTVCDVCDDDKKLKKCHQEDVVVTCKRIKPGSVGMLPGKG